MAFKFVVLAAFVAVANAGFINAPLEYAAAPATFAYAAPVAKAVVAKTIDADYDPNPQYSYAYDVQDSLTGDFKSQQESRNGDIVQGSYSLLESDGTRRIVDYTADSVNGFNAVVRKEPAQVAVKSVAVAPVVKTVAAAPVVKAVHAAPAVYAAPVAHYSAPVAHYSAPVAQYAAPVAQYAAAPVYAKYAAPVAQYAAAPVYAKYAAPLSYAAPAYYH